METRVQRSEKSLKLHLAWLALMPVDENQGPLLSALGLPLQNHQRVILAGQHPLRALLVQRRNRLLHRVDLGDVSAEIEAFALGLVVAGRDHIKCPRPAILEPHRHQHTRRIRRGEGISLAVMRLDQRVRNSGSEQFGHQPFGVMAFGKADRRRYVAKSFVLVEQPWALKVPPFDAVEEIVEAGIGERENCPFRRAQSFGTEDYVRRRRFRHIDQTTPDLSGHLVGGVAAEAAEPESDIVAHEPLKIAEDLALLRGSVVQFGEISPYSLTPGIGGIDGTGRDDIALNIAGEPVRVARYELAVLRGMINHKVHDHAQSMLVCRLGEAA